MRRSIGRANALAVTVSLVLLGLAAPSPAPAQAAVADQVVLAVDDPALGTALHVKDLVAGTDTALPGAAVQDAMYSRTAVSRDGRYVAWTYDRLFSDTVSVYDRESGTLTRVFGVADGSAGDPVWTADGRLVVQAGNDPGAPLALVTRGGAVTLIPGTEGAYGFDVSPGGDQLVFSLRVAGVPKLVISNLDGSGRAPLGVVGVLPAWSHDGSRIAYVRWLTDPDGKPAGSVVATVSPRGTNATTLAWTYRTSGASVAWSPDDARLLLEDPTEAVVVPSGSAGAPETVTAVDSITCGLSWAGPWSPGDSTAPVLQYDPHVVLGDRAASFVWGPYTAAPADDLVGFRIGLAPGMVPPATYAGSAHRITVLGNLYRGTVTGLTAGAVYSYSFWALDAAGNASEPRTGHLQLVSTASVIAGPIVASTSATGLWERLSYATTDPAAAGVSLRYDGYSATGGSSVSNDLGPGIPLARSGVTYFGQGGDPEPLLQGSNYVIRAGTRDAWGNIRWGTSTVRTRIPFDDRSTALRYSGSWLRPATSGTWLATTTMTRTGGSVLLPMPLTRSGAKARQFTVVVTKAPGGGRFKVYVDGRYITTISTASTTVRVRQNVWSSAVLAAGRTHQLRLVQVSGSGWVRLDGVAVLLG